MKVVRSFQNSLVHKILSVLAVLIIVFIWGQSLVPATESADESSRLFTFFKPLFDFIFGEGKITHSIFRKMAHFGEYFVFGLVLSFSFKEFFTLGVSLFVAMFDELVIQMLTPGRGPSLRDVMIDFSGAGTAVLVFLLLGKLFERD